MNLDFDLRLKDWDGDPEKPTNVILTPENWNQYKDDFLEQRLSYRKEVLSLKQRIELQLEWVDSLNYTSHEDRAMKILYRDLLVEKKVDNSSEFPDLASIAVACIHDGIEVTRKKARGIANDYGNPSKSDSLYKKYVHYLKAKLFWLSDSISSRGRISFCIGKRIVRLSGIKI